MFGNLKFWRKVQRAFDRRAEAWAKKTGKSKYAYVETIEIPSSDLDRVGTDCGERARRALDERVVEILTHGAAWNPAKAEEQSKSTERTT